jgi:hypothetical protein
VSVQEALSALARALLFTTVKVYFRLTKERIAVINVERCE